VKAFGALALAADAVALARHVFTLLSMIAAVVLIAGTWLASQSRPRASPATDARSVAGSSRAPSRTGKPLVLQRGAARPGDGSLHAVFSFGPPAWRSDPGGMGLRTSRISSCWIPTGGSWAARIPRGAAFAPASAISGARWRRTPTQTGACFLLNGSGRPPWEPRRSSINPAQAGGCLLAKMWSRRQHQPAVGPVAWAGDLRRGVGRRAGRGLDLRPGLIKSGGLPLVAATRAPAGASRQSRRIARRGRSLAAGRRPVLTRWANRAALQQYGRRPGAARWATCAPSVTAWPGCSTTPPTCGQCLA